MIIVAPKECARYRLSWLFGH